MATPNRPSRSLPPNPSIRFLKDEAKKRVKQREFTTLAQAQGREQIGEVESGHLAGLYSLGFSGRDFAWVHATRSPARASRDAAHGVCGGGWKTKSRIRLPKGVDPLARSSLLLVSRCG